MCVPGSVCPAEGTASLSGACDTTPLTPRCLPRRLTTRPSRHPLGRIHRPGLNPLDRIGGPSCFALSQWPRPLQGPRQRLPQGARGESRAAHLDETVLSWDGQNEVFTYSLRRDGLAFLLHNQYLNDQRHLKPSSDSCSER